MTIKKYFSTRLIVKCVEHDIGLLFCDQKHSPLTDITSSYHQYNKLKRINLQIQMYQKTKDRLWKKIVASKIKNQADCLKYIKKEILHSNTIENYIKDIKPGDKSNREAVAAKKYFRLLFGNTFIRGRYKDTINSSLNYGYSIIRSAIKKELAIRGFEQSIGIHHSSAENSFNLADDILEPFRPFLDAIVYEFVYSKDIKEFNHEIKHHLVSILFEKCVIDNGVYSLYDAINVMINSLIQCYEDNSSAYIKLPQFREVGV